MARVLAVVVSGVVLGWVVVCELTLRLRRARRDVYGRYVCGLSLCIKQS